MPPKQTTELSLEDVEFLQAVRYIENNRDDFERGGDAEGASTTELRTVLEEMWDTGADWSKAMISYRMSGPDKSDGGRGWDVESGFGLVRLHSATLTEDGWTTRRVELTEKGHKRLSQMEKRMDVTRSSGEGEGMATIDSSVTDLELELGKLRDRVSELEQEKAELEDLVENILGDVNTFKETRTGALDNDVSDQLREVFNRVVRQKRVNQMLLNIDTDPFDPEAVPSKEEIEQAQENIRQSILVEGDGVDTSTSTESTGE